MAKVIISLPPSSHTIKFIKKPFFTDPRRIFKNMFIFYYLPLLKLLKQLKS